MTYSLKGLACAAAFMVSVPVSAAGDVTGYITKIRADYDDYVYVQVSQPIGGTRPSCANVNNPYGFVFSLLDGANKQILATALLAYGTGKEVYIKGLGQCGGTNGSVEVVSQLVAQ